MWFRRECRVNFGCDELQRRTCNMNRFFESGRWSAVVLYGLLLTVTISGEDNYSRSVSTYSIVAMNPETGELGVAVQSHWFSVG